MTSRQPLNSSRPLNILELLNSSELLNTFRHIIKRVERVRVDGALVEIKIVEEWGYAMGEDTCLFEEEIASEASQSDCEEGHVDPNVRRNVDMLIDNIAVGMEEVANEVVHGKSDVELPDKQLGNTSGVGESEEEKEQLVDILSPVGVLPDVTASGPHLGDPGALPHDLLHPPL
ncbi:hypothetical protein TSUD_422320 [Trifolium subterraneum]|uniref:DUF4283 domain-containing protein n=1 Tax=Trifolium subterraneum TaxID=3900 RepID=A0A1B5Z7L9_TRISU|nr:hypothetical protein TSUD_422320 [Trifolium subterraneum]